MRGAVGRGRAEDRSGARLILRQFAEATSVFQGPHRLRPRLAGETGASEVTISHARTLHEAITLCQNGPWWPFSASLPDSECRRHFGGAKKDNAGYSSGTPGGENLKGEWHMSICCSTTGKCAARTVVALGAVALFSMGAAGADQA